MLFRSGGAFGGGFGSQQRALPRAASSGLVGQNAVLHVVAHLDFAAAVALRDGRAHGFGAGVGVEDEAGYDTVNT